MWKGPRGILLFHRLVDYLVGLGAAWSKQRRGLVPLGLARSLRDAGSHVLGSVQSSSHKSRVSFRRRSCILPLAPRTRASRRSSKHVWHHQRHRHPHGSSQYREWQHALQCTVCMYVCMYVAALYYYQYYCYYYCCTTFPPTAKFHATR